MSSLQRRPSRAVRERRAYQATVVGGTAALVAVVTGLLAAITSFTWSIPVLAAIVAVVCFLVFRSSVGARK